MENKRLERIARRNTLDEMGTEEAPYFNEAVEKEYNRLLHLNRDYSKRAKNK